MFVLAHPVLFNRDIARIGYVPPGYKYKGRGGYTASRVSYRNSRLTLPAPKVFIPKPTPKRVYYPKKAVQKKVNYPYKAGSHGKAYYPSKVYNPYKKAVNPYNKIANPYKKVYNPYKDVHNPYRGQDVYNSYPRDVIQHGNGTYAIVN